MEKMSILQQKYITNKISFQKVDIQKKPHKTWYYFMVLTLRVPHQDILMQCGSKARAQE